MAILFAVCAVAVVVVGAVAASSTHVAAPEVQGVPASLIQAHRVRPIVRLVVPVHATRTHVRKAQPKPRIRLRATISLYEHTTSAYVLRRQGCRAARRGVGGVVILDFGRPGYNGHTYGTMLFSNRFAGNKAITRGLLGYARGYVGCLHRGSHLQISLARGTSNYHPHVPSAYKAGRRWARETMTLQHLLRAHGLSRHVVSAAADDVEPAWDRTFWRTRDFYRGYARAR
ncbi:MAG TPA: hypothetical protein VLE97_08630, partial [Gaiellaceae bacterium]|nr:hypothetical protein [Gaiellaceae bacterium]